MRQHSCWKIAALSLLFTISQPSLAQSSYWLIPTSSNWRTGPWSHGVPNRATFSAHIGATGSAYTVTMDSNLTLGLLRLDSAFATLNGSGYRFTSTALDLVRGQTSNLVAHNSRVTLAEDVTGSLRLLGTSNNRVSGTIGSGMNLVVDGAADWGFSGVITGTLVNKGTLDFTKSSPHGGLSTHLNGGTLDNQGTLNFLQGNGGTRFLRNMTFTNKGILNASGTGRFESSSVGFLSGSTLTGPGSVDFQGSTVNVHAGSSIFDLGGFSAGGSTVNVHAGSNVSVLGAFSAGGLDGQRPRWKQRLPPGCLHRKQLGP